MSHAPDHSAARLGVIGQLAPPYAAAIAEHFPELRLQTPDADSEALIVWQQDVAAACEAIARARRLSWVHLRWAGVPPQVVQALDGREVALTNGSGAHGPAIAEYVLAVILAHHKRLRAMWAAQTHSEWLVNVGPRELRGSLAGVVGLGDLGGSIARALRGLGVHVRGLRRSVAASSDVDEVFLNEHLQAFLNGLDILVVAAPLTQDTRGMIDADALARLAPGAYLVNVGRAAIVDEPALIEAIRDGQLGGAALDVFLEEPLPGSSPLWTLENVSISPHCADNTPQSLERGFAILLDNVRRYTSGEPLRNVVDRALGY